MLRGAASVHQSRCSQSNKCIENKTKSNTNNTARLHHYSSTKAHMHMLLRSCVGQSAYCVTLNNIQQGKVEHQPVWGRAAAPAGGAALKHTYRRWARACAYWLWSAARRASYCCRNPHRCCAECYSSSSQLQRVTHDDDVTHTRDTHDSGLYYNNN